MPQTMTGSSCACSTSGSAAATPIVPGLVHADLSTIELTQGVPWTWKHCFYKGSKKPFQILEERAGGIIIVSKADHCLVIGDFVRLINYNACIPDTQDSTSVFPVASIVPNVGNPDQDAITLTGLTTIDKTYTVNVVVASSIAPVGCAVGVQTVTDASTLPPYGIEAVDGAPMLITGGVTARDDYYQMFAVSGTSGSNVLYSTELNMVQPGDMVKSTTLGYTTGVKVLRVDREIVQDSTTGSKITRDKITVSAASATTSSCAAIEVLRGLIAPLMVRQVGQCWELTIPGSATRNLQLHKSMKSGSSYDLGTLTVMAFYGTLSGGKLVPRGVELLRSNVMIKPSSLGVL